MTLSDKLVLSIDDSETIRSYLKNVLSPLGVTLEEAATAQDGLEKCAAKSYDIILLDLMLPDADGMEVLRAIRREDTTSTIIMVTGHAGVKSAISAVQQGADGYLLKQDLAMTIRDHSEFLYALEQAVDHRAGVNAQQQLEEIRADFYSMVTHDLRSPASIVYTVLDMLADPELGSLNDGQQQLLAQGQRALTKMLRLITEYLDYAKIDAGYLRLESAEVDLRQLVEDSTQLISLQINAKHQTLRLDIPAAPVNGFVDAERLKQVLDNLLSNAYKYTPEGGEIAVALTTDGDQAIFRISDSGMGIPPQQIPALFAKYHRVPGDATRKILGTGLGLLIVKEIVGAHGGSIHAESEGVEGKGTTFIVNIPLRPTAAKPTPVETSPEIHSSPFTSPFSDEISSGLTQDQKDELFEAFTRESHEQVAALRDALRQLNDTPANKPVLKTAQRLAHTLKGNAAALQMNVVAELAANMENKLRQANRGDVILTAPDIDALEHTLAGIDSGLQE